MPNHCFGEIQWHQFDWGSLSTLFTGIAAVTAAYLIGKKQTVISQQQNQILSRQVDLADAALRASLFEKRLETYETAKDFIIFVMLRRYTVADRPALEKEFAAKIRESLFLFKDQRIYEQLNAVWEKARNLENLREQPDALEEIVAVERAKLIKEWEEYAERSLENLADLFRSDLMIDKP